MKVALLSLEQAWENKKANLELCKKYIRELSVANPELIIFPEMTLTGFSNNVSLIAEKPESSKTIKNFSELAKEFNVAIVFGVVLRSNNGDVFNRAVFVDNFGHLVDSYTKIHSFSFAGENFFFNSGKKLCVVKFKNFTIGLTLCYDLRFPELYSALAKECDLIVNIANWPKKRIKHWDTLLKARAIENQIFIAGVNRIGVDGNFLEYVESSHMFNANGKELQFEKIRDAKIYNIDKNFTKEFRSKFNTVNDRKVEFYKEIL